MIIMKKIKEVNQGEGKSKKMSRFFTK